MSNSTGKTIATLLIGAAIGAAAGYIIATDKEKRSEHFDLLKSTARKGYDEIKSGFDELKHRIDEKWGNKITDIEEEIYNS